MSKRIFITTGVAALILLSGFFLLTQSKSEAEKITVQVIRGL